MTERPLYVLMTAARNEAATIAKTIAAVTRQTLTPLCWTIVSDGSTDSTDELVRNAAKNHSFINLIRIDRPGGHDFAAKVRALNLAVEELSGFPYGFIGNLDADVVVAPHYFEAILKRFLQNPRLGIGGGLLFDFFDGQVHNRRTSLDSVGGGVQLFRRRCYEAVGGYRAMKAGSEDALALHIARWKGWETRSFPDLPVEHHRKTGTAGGSIWRTRFNQGVAQGVFNWSPAFVAARAVYRCTESPYVLGSIVRTAGYCYGRARGNAERLPQELRSFIRKEQRRKLASALILGWRPWETDANAGCEDALREDTAIHHCAPPEQKG